MSTAKVFITEGFDEGFCEKARTELGIDVKSIDDCLPGSYISEGVQKDVDESDFVLVSLTNRQLEEQSHLASFEALVKTYEEQKCCIIPIKFCADAKVPVILHDFQCLDYTVTDDSFWPKLEESLKGKRDLCSVLPVGNVAPGLVWNYFYGYLMRIMKQYPTLYMEKLNSNGYGQNMKGIEKLIIMLPKNCTCKSLLGDYDKNITYLADDPVEQRHDRAGQQKIMLQAVYKVQDADETFVLLLEVPNIITTISKLAGLKHVTFTAEDVRRQYKSFVSALKNALEYEKQLQNLYMIIEFDENDPTVTKNLGKLITSKVREEQRTEPKIEQETEQPMDTDVSYYEYDVNVVTGLANPDPELEQLVTKLREDKIKVYVKEEDVLYTEIQGYVTAIRNARKTMLWIDRQMEELQNDVYNEALFIQEDIRKGLLVPVVRGDPFSQPITSVTNFRHLHHLNHLYSGEPDFYSKLKNAITGDTPLTYPLGDIATGMAWTYCLNYLEQNLDSYVEHYKTTLSYDKESVLYPKFISLIAKTCHAPGQITEYDPTIARMTDDYKEEVMFKKIVAGKERKYNIPINKVTYNNKVYKVMCEFSTPLNALADMEKGMKTQLSSQHKLKQRQIYDDQLQQLVDNGKQIGSPLRHCSILRFNDEFEDQTKRERPKFNLSKLIAELVESDKDV